MIMTNFIGVRFPGDKLRSARETPQLDVSAAAFLTVLVLKLVGAEIDNEPALRETLAAAYTPLAALPNAYRLYPVLPNIVSFEMLLATAESHRPRNVRPVYRWKPLWTPGWNENKYTAAELDGVEKSLVVRVALQNPEDTNYDPLLHLLGVEYDDIHSSNQRTQLKVWPTLKAEFESEHKGYTLTTVTARDFLVMALMDRIEGKSGQDTVLSRGMMRCPELGHRTVRDNSYVGSVYSYGGRLYLGKAEGDACRSEGLGLSAGEADT